MSQNDIYVKVLDELGSFYNGIINRVAFDHAIRKTLTEEECAVWLLFPKHTDTPVTLRSIKSHTELPYFDKAFDHLLKLSFIAEWNKNDGIPHYVRNYLFQLLMAHNVGRENTDLAIALSDWFNTMRSGGASRTPFPNPEYRVMTYEGALTGDESFGEIPMNLSIPDTREVVTFDMVTELVRKARFILRQPCLCRASKDWTGSRECDYPVDVCLLFDDLAEKTYAMGVGHPISADEALEIVKKCRDMGLIQQVSNSKEPSILCNCCSCCCLVIDGYRHKQYISGKPSRFIINYNSTECNSCGKCVSVCPVEALSMKDGKLYPKKEICIGCGLCVSRCERACLNMELRENAEQYLPDREKMDIFFI